MNIQEILEKNPHISLTISAPDLIEFGKTIASQTALIILQNQKEMVFTRETVMQKFGICSATLWRWDKMGLINKKKIGNRVYYLESEIKRLVNTKSL